MKQTTLSLVAMIAMSSFGMAGGGESPVVEPVTVIPAIDQSALYVGIGLSAVSNREAGLNFFDNKAGQDRTGDVTLLAGYEFNPYIALEGRYMTSFTQEDILERDSWGIYVKPQYPMTETINIYALLGYGGFNANGINGANINVDDTGFQWGLGGSYDFTEHILVFVDYVNIANDVGASSFITAPADVSSDAVTIGVNYKF
ncbi:MAG TPA: porin family protein [Epsilonproteobacteria bacterium]|nr:porin family protein [Campylobacterota bacterium]